jgi:hypothetical protein
MSRRMYRRRAQLEPIGIEEVDEIEMEDDDLEDEIAEIENEIEAMDDDEIEAEDEEMAMMYMDDDEEDDEVEAEDMLFMDDDEIEAEDEEMAMMYMDDDEEDDEVEAEGCMTAALDIDVPADSMVQDYDEVSEWLGTTTQGEDMVEVLDKEYLVANSGRIKEACRRLDRVASSLEKRGKVDLAYRVDKISDALESQLNK